VTWTQIDVGGDGDSAAEDTSLTQVDADLDSL
jgi:hypothetical protein